MNIYCENSPLEKFIYNLLKGEGDVLVKKVIEEKNLIANYKLSLFPPNHPRDFKVASLDLYGTPKPIQSNLQSIKQSCHKFFSSSN